MGSVSTFLERSEQTLVIGELFGVLRGASGSPFFVPESPRIPPNPNNCSGIGDRDRDRGFLAQLMNPAILPPSPITSPGFFSFEQLFWKNYKPLFLKDK